MGSQTTTTDLRKVCLECLNQEKLTRVAIYSRTLCTEHAEAEFDNVIASATSEDWDAAWVRVLQDERNAIVAAAAL